MNGCIAGAVGAFAGNPIELALIRMQGDNIAEKHLKKGYTNIFNTLSKIRADEGAMAWLQGVKPTVVRAIVMNMVMLSSNDQIREMMDNKGYGWTASNVTAASLSGILSAVTTCPLDNCKTRLQNMRPDANGI